MSDDKFFELVKKVQDGEATLEEKTLVLKELNLATDEYIGLLRARIDELKK